MTQKCSNHHFSLSLLRPKGFSCSKMKWLVIYTNLTVNAIVTLPHSPSRDSQRQVTFLAPSVNKKTRNYPNLLVNVIIRLPHLRSRDSQDHETSLAPSPEKQFHNYDARVFKPPSLSIENDNISSQHLGRKGLHLNPKRKGRLALKFMKQIRKF